MDLPTFDGSDARARITCVEQYFLVHKTPNTQKVEIAMIALSGPAMLLLVKIVHEPDWATFKHELLICFDVEPAVNGYEALISVKQTGSLKDYMAIGFTNTRFLRHSLPGILLGRTKKEY